MTDYYKDKQQMIDEQIAELAPDWATHYEASSRTVAFFDVKGAVSFNIETKKMTDKFDNELGIQPDDKPIPRKKFDISEYEFSDKRIGFSQDDKGLLVEVEGDFYEIAYVNKNDAIAIAKHFSLTAEDLK